jgi:hypothetical protein
VNASPPFASGLTGRRPSSILEPVGLIPRLAALLLCVGLVAGNPAVCAGWAGTPEARMDCCDQGWTCPMHQGSSHHSESSHPITQAQADSCCGQSEQDSSSPPAPASVAAIPAAVLDSGVLLPPIVPSLMLSDHWRTVAPAPTAPVPKHVLLSVFLV